MKKLSSFLLLSLDGYYADPKGDTSWAHGRPDPEYDAFTNKNAGAGGTLLMGRKTYETMVAFWPTPQAKKAMPDVAKVMNESQKIVFSTTLTKSDWANTRFVKGDLAKEARKLKQEADSDIVILGSGSIVKELAEANLVDEFQFVVSPILLGAGLKMFDGMKEHHDLELEKTHKFANGIVVSTYAPSKR